MTLQSSFRFFQKYFNKMYTRDKKRLISCDAFYVLGICSTPERSQNQPWRFSLPFRRKLFRRKRHRASFASPISYCPTHDRTFSVSQLDCPVAFLFLHISRIFRLCLYSFRKSLSIKRIYLPRRLIATTSDQPSQILLSFSPSESSLRKTNPWFSPNL